MTHYADLSRYSYERTEKSTFNIGWLSDQRSYVRGEPPRGFTERLQIFCWTKVNQTRGLHSCEFCGDVADSPAVLYGEETVSLGSAEIRVFGPSKRRLFGSRRRVYAAPDLIYHYVDKHKYLPPREFIDAVLDGSLPGSTDYESLAAAFDWHEDYRNSFKWLKQSRLKNEEGTLRTTQLAFPEASAEDMVSIVYCLGTTTFEWQYGEMVRILTKIDEETIDALAKSAPKLIARGETDSGKMVYRLTAEAEERFLAMAPPHSEDASNREAPG